MTCYCTFDSLMCISDILPRSSRWSCLGMNAASQQPPSVHPILFLLCLLYHLFRTNTLKYSQFPTLPTHFLADIFPPYSPSCTRRPTHVCKHGSSLGFGGARRRPSCSYLATYCSVASACSSFLPSFPFKGKEGDKEETTAASATPHIVLATFIRV
jgi:hypothetical protein